LGMEFDDQPSPEQKEIILSILKQNFTSSNTVYSSQADFLERYYPDCRSVREALESELGSEQVLYAAGCGIKEAIPGGIEEALRCVEGADIVVAVLGGLESMVDEGATCGENRDNTNTDLEQPQRELMEAVFAAGKPVVSVLIDGRPLSVSSVSKNSKALLHAWLPAEHGGEAIADILTGKRSPSGKLPVTMVRDVSQIPMHYDRLQLFTDPEVWAEYINDEQNRPLYPFGHGLTYTQFAYENLTVDKTVDVHGTVRFCFTVRNTGNRAGEEVAQVYIRDVISSVARPCLQLAAFAKIALAPGEAKTVSAELDLRQLAFHDSRMRLVVEPGEMELLAGASSADIRLRDRFTVTGEALPVKRRVHHAKVSVQ
ncbi:MAG: glycoside hydrolase family 3 C-terminal domain-containing protein, partial [Ruminococcus flavefaciens]|nr:glycoside hydrolase family 3 C-terminal domain-containing protein [Ruminococcus flavefaciens]